MARPDGADLPKPVDARIDQFSWHEVQSKAKQVGERATKGLVCMSVGAVPTRSKREKVNGRSRATTGLSEQGDGETRSANFRRQLPQGPHWRAPPAHQCALFLSGGAAKRWRRLSRKISKKKGRREGRPNR